MFKLTPAEEKIRRSIMPYVTFPLINVCTQKCVYCGDGAEMTLCDVRQVNMEDVLEWHVAARELGVEKFRITGGETLLHKDFREIIDTIAKDANVVLVNTNGTLLKRFPEKWMGSPSNCQYVVNYHGASEEVYDIVSATTGYYDVVREGIEMLAHEGLLYRLNTVMNKHNIHEIWDIIAYCKELGTDLKIQDVVSVPWAFNQWHEVYVDTVALEKEFEKRASFIRDHRYATSFGTPTKIYTIDGVNITLKSVRNGSHYDMEGICDGCPFYPCHEGVYDVFVFADNTAWACNWTPIAKAPEGTKKEQLSYMVEVFQRSVYREAAQRLNQMTTTQELPEKSELLFVELDEVSIKQNHVSSEA